MEIKNTSKFGISILLVIPLAIIGCSASGPAFKPVNPIPYDKGVVYIYREPSFAGSGVYGTVTANKMPITKIKNGGYFPFIANPGNVHFEVSTETTNEADVTVEVGKEKYLKTTVGMGLLVGHLNFSEVSPEIGKREISECKLLEPITP
ncbi:MAG: DUF2846 domain-containing protein [Methylococcaceae bacterium]|nr:DUF2846 domain-containing protein [Methylococcaceae bacterium]